MEQNNFLPSQEKKVDVIKIESRTVASENHSSRNEDAILVDYKNNVFGVFDGMGGHSSGDKASNMAKDCVTYGLTEMPNDLSADEKTDYLSDVLAGANKLIIDQAKTDKTDMGTTAVVGLIHKDELKTQAIVASVGDSRTYLYRDGILEQITMDDDAAKYEFRNKISKVKEIQKKLSNVVNPQTDLTDEEQTFFNRRNQISAALGIPENFRVQTYIVDIKPGDKLLFCSDGLSDNLTENQIATTMSDKKDIASNLINMAIETSRNGFNPRNKKDDMSAIVVEIQKEQLDKESKKSPIQEGDRVNVIRSNGEFNHDYVVTNIGPDNVATAILKKDNEIISRKNIPLSSLEIINKTPLNIESAKNIPDLYRYLKSVGNVVGKSGTYLSTDLIKIIDGVEKGQYEPNTITRTDGLRDKVKEILKIK